MYILCGTDIFQGKKVMAQKITYSADFKRNYVAVLAVTLFLLMIAGEIALAVSIPVYMKRENVLAQEVYLRETLLNFDGLRQSCNAIKSNDEVVLLEKQLISSGIDQMALYLRHEANRLTPEETRQIRIVTDELHRIVARLRKNQSFSQEKRLDSSAYIDSLVKKYPVKGK